jgi:hypothetical protein
MGFRINSPEAITYADTDYLVFQSTKEINRQDDIFLFGAMLAKPISGESSSNWWL